MAHTMAVTLPNLYLDQQLKVVKKTGILKRGWGVEMTKRARDRWLCRLCDHFRAADSRVTVVLLSQKSRLLCYCWVTVVLLLHKSRFSSYRCVTASEEQTLMLQLCYCFRRTHGTWVLFQRSCVPCFTRLDWRKCRTSSIVVSRSTGADNLRCTECGSSASIANPCEEHGWPWMPAHRIAATF